MRGFDESFEKVLSGRKYDILTGRAPNLREIFANILDDIYNTYILPILRRLRFNAPGGETAGLPKNTLRNVFITAAVLLAVAAVFFIVRRLRAPKASGKTTREIIEALKTNATTYDKLLSEAAVFAEKGLYRDAVRYEYIALLWVLNTRGVIYLTDYKTNSQIKREIHRNAPPIYESFSDVVGMFNIAWFGHKDITPEAYNNNRARITALVHSS